MARHDLTSSSARSLHQQQQPQQLPTALQLHILSLLPPNERALSGRFACRDAADALSCPQRCTASLSAPLPSHAAPWAQEAGQQHVRQLPFRHKFQLLCAAACSGSEVNLEVAWALLEPSVFPELLQNEQDLFNPYPDPGVAAVRTGHPHLLGWLLRRCPGLVQPDEVLAAAALHCDLAELQQAWETLRDHFNIGSSSSDGGGGSGGSHSKRVHLNQAVLNAADKSRTQDAVAKMEWLLVAGAGSCRLQPTTAIAAISGDLGRVQWLRDRGCPFSQYTLLAVLEEASLPVAQWLVGKGVCELSSRVGEGEDSSSWSWRALMHAAARSSDGVVKLQWLQEQGAPGLMGVDARLARDVGLTAVGAGRVEVVQYLASALRPVSVIQDPPDQDTFGKAAVKSGSTHMVQCLVQEAGLVLSHKAYNWAAEVGGLDMVRWLAGEAAVSAASCDLGSLIELWPRNAQADSRALLEAVQLVVGGGCCMWNAADAMAAAAKWGDLALAQYLHRQREHTLCGQVRSGAVMGGCAALLEWISERSHRYWPPHTDRPYCDAASKQDKGTLAALRRLGVPWGNPSLLVGAVYRECQVPVLQWLVEQGAPVGRRGDLLRAVEVVVQRWGLDGDRAAQLQSWAAGASMGATACQDAPSVPAAGRLVRERLCTR